MLTNKQNKHRSKLIKTVSLKNISDLSKVHLAIFILVFAGIGSYILLPSRATGSTANVWVSAAGSDTGSNCYYSVSPVAAPANPATACATLNHAYQLVSGCGAEIGFESGQYTAQTISYNTTLGASCVSNRITLQPDNSVTSANTAFANLTFSGARDINFDGPFAVTSNLPFSPATAGMINVKDTATQQAQNITVDGLVANGIHGGNLNNLGGLNVTFRYTYVDYEGIDNGTQGSHIDNDSSNGWLSDNTVYDHDKFWGPLNSGHYADCIHQLGGGSVSVTNSEFLWCADYGLLLDGINTNSTTTSLIENDVYMGPHSDGVGGSFLGLGCSGVGSVGAPFVAKNFHVLFNTSYSGILFDSTCGSSWPNSIFEGNIWQATYNCNSQGASYFTIWSYNLDWNPRGSPSSPCASTDKLAVNTPNTSIWVSPATVTGDFHLAPTSSAIGAAGAAPLVPTSDYEGSIRTGPPYDAGAYQSSSGGTPSCPLGDLNGDCHVTISDLSILLSNYGTANTNYDLNKNGIVDISDLSILLSNYGK